jgi:recombinational DNA repair protein RecT
VVILETENIIVNTIEDRIFGLKFKDFKLITIEDALKVTGSITKYYTENDLTEPGMMLVEFGHGATIDKEAREYGSSKEGNNHTHGAAMLVKTMAQQLIGDYYLKFNHPRYPTRVFYKKEKALTWIRKRLSEIE